MLEPRPSTDNDFSSSLRYELLDLPDMSDRTWNQRFAFVEAYIDEHHAKLETPRDVAAVVDVSYERLQKHFLQQNGFSVDAYLRETRVEAARRLLVETEQPIHAVCRNVGFLRSSICSQAFRQEMGLSMREYRRRYHLEGEEPDDAGAGVVGGVTCHCA